MRVVLYPSGVHSPWYVHSCGPVLGIGTQPWGSSDVLTWGSLGRWIGDCTVSMHRGTRRCRSSLYLPYSNISHLRSLWFGTEHFILATPSTGIITRIITLWDGFEPQSELMDEEHLTQKDKANWWPHIAVKTCGLMNVNVGENVHIAMDLLRHCKNTFGL